MKSKTTFFFYIFKLKIKSIKKIKILLKENLLEDVCKINETLIMLHHELWMLSDFMILIKMKRIFYYLFIIKKQQPKN